MAVTVLLVALALGAVAGAAYQMAGAMRDAQSLPAPGRLIDVDSGRRLHLASASGDGPTVVFEAGISATSLSWTLVQPRVSRFARTFSYDRAGLGWSDASPSGITAAGCAEDLHRLITTAGIPAPCVLVGHSYAGFILHVYATRHPENVAGLVLVDPIYPEEWLAMSPREFFRLRGGVFLSRVGAALAAIGVVRFSLNRLLSGSRAAPRRIARLFGSEAAQVMTRLAREVQKLPETTWPAISSHWSRPRSFLSMARHLAGLRASAAEVAACGDVPAHIPLTVISGIQQPPHYREAHARMTAGVKNGRHVMATGSGHWILLDEPELVVEAVRDVLDRAARSPA